MGVHSVAVRVHVLSTLVDAFLTQYYARHPVNATFTGVHAHDGRLPDWSRAARLQDADEMRTLHEALTTAHPTSHLPPEAYAAALNADVDLLDAELARANLEVRLAEFESGFFHDRNPALWTGEAIFGAASLMIRPFASCNDRLPSLTARLAAIDDFLQVMRTTLQSAIPVPWIDRARKECRAAMVLFDEGLALWLTEEPCDHERVIAVRIAAGHARDAFAACERWLAQLPQSADASLACGAALYDVLLRRGHFSTHSATDLLVQATQELATEQAALARMLSHRGWTLADAQQAMAADHPTAAQYENSFHRRWAECRALALQHDIVTWPEWPIRYVAIPPWARASAPSLYWLFYRSPAPFDAYTTCEYLVTPIDDVLDAHEQEQRLRVWNFSAITLNHVVHHGAIGHHVQNWHAIHRGRSRLGQIAAVDCASRISMFFGGTMAEGWACYATGLMEELGLLTDLERVSEQHTRVRLLARAIADVQLHTGAHSLAETIQFYVTEVGMPLETATAEANKNSMFPCTAVMYWLGTRGIRNLRARMHARDGSNFVPRTFHDDVLSRGAIPVALVAAMMEASVT